MVCGLLSITIRDINIIISPYFSQQFESFLRPETLGEKIQRSCAYIIMVNDVASINTTNL